MNDLTTTKCDINLHMGWIPTYNNSTIFMMSKIICDAPSRQKLTISLAKIRSFNLSLKKTKHADIIFRDELHHLTLVCTMFSPLTFQAKILRIGRLGCISQCY